MFLYRSSELGLRNVPRWVMSCPARIRVTAISTFLPLIVYCKQRFLVVAVASSAFGKTMHRISSTAVFVRNSIGPDGEI